MKTKTEIKMKKLTIHVFIPVVITVLMLGILILPAKPAYAEGADAPQFLITRTPIAPLAKDAAAAALSNFFKREQNWLNQQTTHLQKSAQIATTTQQLIDAARAEGQDTSSLETALAQFKGTIASAQADHDQAAGILAAANGFDGSGTVTDLNAARRTVESARLSLRSAHIAIAQATNDLMQILNAWKNSH
jgi:hypothetical protein